MSLANSRVTALCVTFALVAVAGYTCTLGCSQEESPRDVPKDWTSLIDGKSAFRDLERYVELGPARHTPEDREALAACRAFIREGLTEAGVTDLSQSSEWVQLVATNEKKVMQNIIGILPGKKPDAVLISCHYDIKILPGIEEFEGANDGASGVALTLALARSLVAESKKNGPLDYSYWFTFFDGEEAFVEWRATNSEEEQDNTYGSRRLAARADSLPIRAQINLDLVGDHDLLLTEDTNSTPALMRMFIDESRRVFGVSLFGRRQAMEDDHIPFINAGIPAIDLIDFDFGPGHTHWHRAGDVVENCSPHSLEKVGTLVLSARPALERWLDSRSENGK